MQQETLIARVPIDPWWGVDTIAEYLDMEKRQVRERITKSTGFPKPSTLKFGKTTSRARWKASEVIEWANTHFQRVSDDQEHRKSA